MKRYGNLYDTIISLDNLRLADNRARRRKCHTYGVKLHDRNREENLQQLHEQLKSGTYRTSAYSTFTIHEPKERLIFRLPYFPDRIVHHAVMNILEPIWVATFTADTYSCIKGRGIQAAADRVRKTIDRDKPGCAYCLKIDVKKFYPSINHAILKKHRPAQNKRYTAFAPVGRDYRQRGRATDWQLPEPILSKPYAYLLRPLD